MHYTTISGAAVLLALAPSVLAVGSATLVNSCGFPIYYVADAGQYGGMTALQPGGTYSAPYSDPDQGVSIKIAPTDDLGGPISQFEFTWAAGKINYDISNINGQPFSSNGITLTPSVSEDAGNPTCLPVDCPAQTDGSTATCSAAYNAPNDVDTMVCDDSVSLTMVVCTGSGAAPSGSAPSSEPSSSNGTGTSWGSNPPKREIEPALLHAHHRFHTRHFPRK